MAQFNAILGYSSPATAIAPTTHARGDLYLKMIETMIIQFIRVVICLKLVDFSKCLLTVIYVCRATASSPVLQGQAFIIQRGTFQDSQTCMH